MHTLGKKMSEKTRTRDTEQSDREYIIQQQKQAKKAQKEKQEE